jgi:hypothetical protein
LRFIRKKITNRGKKYIKSDSLSIEKAVVQLTALKVEIQGLEMVSDLKWDYYEHLFTFPSFTDMTDWSSKHRGVMQSLDLAAPVTIVDIGSNRGWYAQFAASRGIAVIALDRDDTFVSLLYKDAKRQNLPLQPLVMDIVWPTPTQGLLGIWGSAVDRLKCEMVMALALIHHLVHSEGMRFDQVVDGLSQFTTCWLLIEFVPYEDPNLCQWKNLSRRDWYNLETLLTVLADSYDIIKVMESDPPERTLILAKKIT